MPLQWRKTWISDETFEAAGVFDVNGDGVPDIVSGEFWYAGPEFRAKHEIGPVRRVGEYYDDFSVLPMDINGDGHLDFVTGGWWGNTLRWRENSGDPDRPWPEHIIAEVGNIETTRAWDMDGDGEVEFLPNTPGSREVAYYKLIRDAEGKGSGSFRKVICHTFPPGEIQGHGLGCGDIAGHGRMDIILGHGWLEAPAHAEGGDWIWHPELPQSPWGRAASVPMLVVDVNGDGRNEIITGHAHGYGLWWSAREDDGRWTHHAIDPFNAQYHDLQWADIDGDGLSELVTGKRHRAHCGHDVGEWDDVGIYYFKWTGEGFAKQVIDYGPIGKAKGCGIQFALADLRGSGRLDLVAPGKDGLYVYFNEGRDGWA